MHPLKADQIFDALVYNPKTDSHGDEQQENDDIPQAKEKQTTTVVPCSGPAHPYR